MKNTILHLLNKILNKGTRIVTSLEYGKDVTKHFDCFITIQSLLKICEPKIIFDIGANTGQWSCVFSKLCSQCTEIIFFEPQHKCFLELNKLVLPDIKTTVFHCAVGSRKEQGILRGGSPAASILKDSPSLHEYFPDAFNREAKEEIEIKTLDSLCAEYNLPVPDCIKIDVQGYELEVLKGAVSTLKKTKYLAIELSLYRFYDNQPLLWEVLRFLSESNFEMVSRGFELRSPDNRQLLQFDGIFANKLLVTEFN